MASAAVWHHGEMLLSSTKSAESLCYKDPETGSFFKNSLFGQVVVDSCDVPVFEESKTSRNMSILDMQDTLQMGL